MGVGEAPSATIRGLEAARERAGGLSGAGRGLSGCRRRRWLVAAAAAAGRCRCRSSHANEEVRLIFREPVEVTGYIEGESGAHIDAAFHAEI